MTLKTKSNTIKFAVLQALSELGRPANVSDIYEHIVNKRLYTLNSPQAKKIVDQTIKIHTENTKRTDIRRDDILFICDDDFRSSSSLIRIHENGAKLLFKHHKHQLLPQREDDSFEQLSKDIGTTPAELEKLSASNTEAIATARKSGIEGARRLFIHYGRERSLRLSKDAKKAYLAQHGKLTCEACGTEPVKTYGVEIIEAHHKIPLSESKGSRNSVIEDFLLLCPSCHRAIHMLPDCDMTALIRKLKN
jgi:hypothetical protein